MPPGKNPLLVSVSDPYSGDIGSHLVQCQVQEGGSISRVNLWFEGRWHMRGSPALAYQCALQGSWTQLLGLLCSIGSGISVDVDTDDLWHSRYLHCLSCVAEV